MKKKHKEHTHIYGVHEGHNLLDKPPTIAECVDACCGGIEVFAFCPRCGEKLKSSIKWVMVDELPRREKDTNNT